MRKCVSRGVSAPKSSKYQAAQRVWTQEGYGMKLDSMGESSMHLAGWLARGACKEDDPETWEALPPSTSISGQTGSR